MKRVGSFKNFSRFVVLVSASLATPCRATTPQNWAVPVGSQVGHTLARQWRARAGEQITRTTPALLGSNRGHCLLSLCPGLGPVFFKMTNLSPPPRPAPITRPRTDAHTRRAFKRLFTFRHMKFTSCQGEACRLQHPSQKAPTGNGPPLKKGHDPLKRVLGTTVRGVP